MKTWVKITLSAAFLVSGCLSAAPPSSLSVAPKTAEQDELVTDRPDFTESSEVTRRNWTQVESGVALELSSQDHERRLSLGNLLVRMGLTDRLELRLGSEGLMHDAGSSPVSAGLFGRSDMDAGFKYKFMDEGRLRPAMSVIASLSLPIGTSTYTSGAYEPTVKLTWAKALPVGFNASGNFNWDVLASDQGRVVQRTTTLSVSHSIGKGFDEYWEIYGFTDSVPGEGTTGILQTGVSHGIGVDAQWDVSVAHRITAQGPDWILSAGLAFRRPTGLISRSKKGTI